MIKFNYYITRINLQYVPKFMVASEHNDTCYDSTKFKDNGSRRVQRYYHLRYAQNGM